MGNTFHARTTKQQEIMHQRQLNISKGLNYHQKLYIVEERLNMEKHCKQLYALGSHALSEDDIKETSKIGVLCHITLKEMKKLYTVFKRISSTSERHTTIQEISLYFNVRRTVLLETCLTRVFPNRERLSLPQFILTMLAFCTCDHHELISILTDYCAHRNEATLEYVLIAVHGAPLRGNIEALLTVLNTLQTVDVDVTLYDRQLNKPCANVTKLVNLNNIYPSLLYPSFKLQAIIKEKCLGNVFWNRVRPKLALLGIHGMFTYRQWKDCVLHFYNKNLHDRRTDVMIKSKVANVLPKFLQPSMSQEEKLNKIMSSVENYRPYKTCSVVNMNEDNSEGLAWEISCSHVAKSAAVEMLLNEEEEEAIHLQQMQDEFGGRTQIPGSPLNWLELTEGMYSKRLWRWMSDNGGYSMMQKIQKGCHLYEDRAKALNVGLSKMLRDIAYKEEDETTATDVKLDDATLLAKTKAERRLEDSKLETIQKTHWDKFWRSFVDPRTQRPFYYNFLTGERSWIEPRGMKRINRKKKRRKQGENMKQMNGDDDDENNNSITTTSSVADENGDERTLSGRASPPSMKEQGLTPKERKRKAKSESMNKTKYLLAQTWGLEAAIEKEKKHQKELLGSKKGKKIKSTAMGEVNENVPLYIGNIILIVTNATKYAIKTEKVRIVDINVPEIPNLGIKKRKGKQGHHKQKYRKPTSTELKKQKEDTTYDVIYLLDNYEEKNVVRTRLMAF
jgi:hypothetical protein